MSKPAPILEGGLVPRTVPPDVSRRQLLTLLAYVQTGSHKAAAHHLGVSVATSRQRISALLLQIGVRNAAQAVWLLRDELAREQGERYTFVEQQNGRSVGS